VVSATFTAFLPALHNDFVNWDDVGSLLGNPYYKGLGWANLRWMFTATLMGHYVPLTWLSFGVNFVLGGMDPWGYHLGNLLLHAANAGVFYLVARRLLAAGLGGGVGSGTSDLRDPALCVGAAFAALAFGIHPLRVESVAWATERRDVLSGLFYLLAVLSYLRGVGGRGALETRYWALSVGAFLLSLLSKAAGMPLPAALLVLDIYPLRRVEAVGWRRLLLEKVPYLLLAGAAGVAALIAQSRAEALVEYRYYTIGPRLATMGYSLLFYPWKFLWWADLSPFYELPAEVKPLSARFVLPAVLLVLVTGVLVALRRRAPALLAAWVYSVLLVLPVSGIALSGSHLVADRYSYLSGLGFALLPGAGLVWVLRMRQKLKTTVVAGCLLVAALVLAVLGAGAWRQSTTWRDTETLWRHALAVDPGNARAHYYLAYWLFLMDRPEEARAEYEQVVALTDSPRLKASSLWGIGASLNKEAIAKAKRGEFAPAVGLLAEALRVAPGLPEACHDLRELAKVTQVEPQDLATCP
jgi:protein O-mannosyl-transferase